jgi:V-type H+-transporting ATPase subunit G
MASQTQGIQQLLAAEKRAAEKVSEARKRKKINSSKMSIFRH